MTSGSIFVPESDYDALERIVALRSKDRVQVARFLRRYPFLVPILLEAHQRVLQHFPDSALSLRILADPEVDDGFAAEELILAIATHFDVDVALERRRRLADEWWLDVLPTTHGKLSIDLDCA